MTVAGFSEVQRYQGVLVRTFHAWGDAAAKVTEHISWVRTRADGPYGLGTSTTVRHHIPSATVSANPVEQASVRREGRPGALAVLVPLPHRNRRDALMGVDAQRIVHVGDVHPTPADAEPVVNDQVAHAVGEGT